MRPKLIIFASGTSTGGGSGFENLVNAERAGVLDAEIVAVVSNHEHGGVRQRADRLGVPFRHFVPGATPLARAAGYQRIMRETGAQWTALSGWLKLLVGLNPRTTFNIHPALLSQLNGRFGGAGMYGHHVHTAVKKALDVGEIHESGCTMHFVTEKYDEGPVCVEVTVPLTTSMSAEDIGSAVNALEHRTQPIITNLIIHGKIAWDGKNRHSLIVPSDLTEVLGS